jgi:hypothetical protein
MEASHACHHPNRPRIGRNARGRYCGEAAEVKGTMATGRMRQCRQAMHLKAFCRGQSAGTLHAGGCCSRLNFNTALRTVVRP